MACATFELVQCHHHVLLLVMVVMAIICVVILSKCPTDGPMASLRFYQTLYVFITTTVSVWYLKYVSYTVCREALVTSLH